MPKKKKTFRVDFNSHDRDGHISVSMRLANQPDLPVLGEKVRLYDLEGNRCEGRVSRVGYVFSVECDWDTFRPK